MIHTEKNENIHSEDHIKQKNQTKNKLDNKIENNSKLNHRTNEKTKIKHSNHQIPSPIQNIEIIDSNLKSNFLSF